MVLYERIEFSLVLNLLLRITHHCVIVYLIVLKHYGCSKGNISEASELLEFFLSNVPSLLIVDYEQIITYNLSWPPSPRF